jgi:two-component system KDP operon response regulator KdpE
VLLERALPDLEASDLIEELRQRADMPVIMMAQRPSIAEKVRGLESGADDYLAKPLSLDELVARVNAMLRRRRGPAPVRPVIRSRHLEIDLGRRLVFRDGREIRLTRNEWSLLEVLAENAGRVIFNTELLARVWGNAFVNEDQYLRVWVSRLRRKLDEEPRSSTVIRNFPGIGYMLTTLDTPNSAAPDAA